MNTEIKISTRVLSHWFNALRNVEDCKKGRALDAFWSGQIDSKAWLVNTLNTVLKSDMPKNVYIFGGWLGVLGNMLITNATWNVGSVRSIDIDPWCEGVANDLNQPFVINGQKFKAVTADMGEFKYDWDIYPDIVINTSTEHIHQDVYDKWWDAIPDGTLIVLQGNDFNACGEHVRCSDNLAEFRRMNHVVNPLWEGSLKHDIYVRYMTIVNR